MQSPEDTFFTERIAVTYYSDAPHGAVQTRVVQRAALGAIPGAQAFQSY